MTIIKKISAIVLALVMAVMCVQISFAEEGIFDTSNPGDGITDKDGSITVKGTLDLPGGFPVTIFVAPQIKENDIDVTLDKLSSANAAEFLSMVEYTKPFTLSEDGKVNISFKVKDSMPTGVANVYVSCNGINEIFYIGYFEHVGKDDVNTLVQLKFNAGTPEDYPGYIAADIEGKEILRKLSANVAGYSELDGKTDFANILYSLKNEGFTAITLVDSFNEAVAWIELWEKEDTLSVLNSYNSVFWNVDLSEESDYKKLSENSQKEILEAIKNAKLSDKESLDKTLNDEIALANFREVTDRNAFSELISNDVYSDYFEEVQKIIKESELDEYDLISVYNYVLKKNSNCTTKRSMESLFTEAIKKVKEGNKPSGGGGGGGGGGGSASAGGSNTTTSDVVLVVPGEVVEMDPREGFIKATEHPFIDVKAEHWANDYITKMYKDGVISGKTETSFAPEEKIVRQDFVKLIISMLGIEKSTEKSIFKDVEKGGYYEPYIMAAVSAGIINGTDENTFGMSVSIKREDVAVIIGRILASRGFTSESESQFSDSAQISAYAVQSVSLTAANGLFNGDDKGNFNPAASLTRAEAAAVLVRLSEIINK